MEKITINSKEYQIKKIDFNAICELEDLGVSILDIQGKTFKSLRGLFAFVADCDKESAAKEIESHLINGGNIDDFTPLFKMISESDFFRNLSKQQ